MSPASVHIGCVLGNRNQAAPFDLWIPALMDSGISLITIIVFHERLHSDIVYRISRTESLQQMPFSNAWIMDIIWS